MSSYWVSHKISFHWKSSSQGTGAAPAFPDAEISKENSPPASPFAAEP